MVAAGDMAPPFALSDAASRIISLQDFRGKYVVLYFYPKDDTTGCTKEALDFNALKSEFLSLNAEIAGVSPDSVKSHAKFRNKYNLDIALLSDGEKSAIEAYGVWVEKKMYGKTYMGVERTTFLIDPAGKVLAVWRGVKVPGHAAAVLEALKAGNGDKPAIV